MSDFLKLDIARIITDETNDLTPAIRALLKELWEELKIVDIRLAAVSRQIEVFAAKHDTARRLMMIPGIGPIGATALITAVGDDRQFRKARDLAAWLGLVPRQYSTGGDRIGVWLKATACVNVSGLSRASCCCSQAMMRCARIVPNK